MLLRPRALGVTRTEKTVGGGAYCAKLVLKCPDEGPWVAIETP